MKPSSFRSSLACVLALVLNLVVLTPAVAADGSGLLRGRVVDSDGFTPRTGVVVALYDADADRVIRSEPTNGDGAFRIEAVPASYALLAETSEGAFLAEDDLRLESGANPAISLSLRSARPNYQTGGTAGGTTQVGGWANWVQWTIAGAIAVGGLLAIDQVTKDEEAPASAF